MNGYLVFKNFKFYYKSGWAAFQEVLWILSKNSHIDADTYKKLLEKIKEEGYDVCKLKKHNTQKLAREQRCPGGH